MYTARDYYYYYCDVQLEVTVQVTTGTLAVCRSHWHAAMALSWHDSDDISATGSAFRLAK
jgi:hypothetical protein